MSVPEEIVVQRMGSFNVPGNIITALFQNSDLLRNFRWRLTFPDDIVDREGRQQIIKPDDCQSMEVPFSSIEPVPWVRDGTVTQYANGPESFGGTFVVNLYEESSGRVMTAIQAWKSMIRNADGTRNYPRFYKKNLTLQLTDGLKVPKVEIILRGCWPGPTSMTQLTYDAPSDKVVIAQTIVIDDAIITQTGVSFSDVFRNPAKIGTAVRQILGF